MTVLAQTAIGIGLALAGWLIARAVAGARHLRPLAALLFDMVAPTVLFGVLIAASGEPIFAGIVTFAAFGGFAFADIVKRAVLREPVVFTDLSEIRELFRHPDLYLPFAGTGRVIAGALAALAFFVLAYLLEPPIFHPPAALRFIAIAMPVVTVVVIDALFVASWAERLRRFAPCGDLCRDAVRFGPLAVLGIYGVIARDERPRRRAAARPGTHLSLPPGSRPPLILIQSESFFDVARLHPSLRTELPMFQQSLRGARQYGRLEVPCWGANTTRTEFAVLSGLADAALGFDRINPYHAFAKAPIDSLAWALKAEGYRTICVHPFDPTFYSRHRIMPKLGFDHLFGEEVFGHADRDGTYIGDIATARLCASLLEAHRDERIFIFVITMENHGPWDTAPPSQEETATLLRGLPLVAEASSLARYLRGLRNADAMIAALREALRCDGRGGLLGFYGDHLPSFRANFAALGFTDTRTDYFLWSDDESPPLRKDIAAHELCGDILATLSQRVGLAIEPA